jgi:hypothetical protein
MISAHIERDDTVANFVQEILCDTYYMALLNHSLSDVAKRRHGAWAEGTKQYLSLLQR